MSASGSADIRDVALVQERDGGLTVHRAECPDARLAANEGLPVIMMLGISRPILKDWHRWHACMLS